MFDSQSTRNGINDYNEDDIIDLWNNEQFTDAEKRFSLAGIISSLAKKYRTRCAVVGGTATEIYTASNYATRDIDFIVTDLEQVPNIMHQIGFHKEGRVWVCDDTGFCLDFPDDTLDGSWGKINEMDTSYGKVSIIGIEDIIVDRIARIESWGNYEEYDPADENSWKTTDEVVFYLLAVYREQIDWSYLKKRGKELSIEKKMSSFLGYFKKYLGNISDRNPKRQEIYKSKECQDYIESIKSHAGEPAPQKDCIRYKQVFFYYANIILNGKHWSSETDTDFIRLMAKNGENPFKIKKSLAYSPTFLGLNSLEKTLKARILYNEFIQKIKQDQR